MNILFVCCLFCFVVLLSGPTPPPPSRRSLEVEVNTADLGRAAGAGCSILSPWLCSSAGGDERVWQGLWSLGENHCGTFKEGERLPRAGQRVQNTLWHIHQQTTSIPLFPLFPWLFLHCDFLMQHKLLQIASGQISTVPSAQYTIKYPHKVLGALIWGWKSLPINVA